MFRSRFSAGPRSRDARQRRKKVARRVRRAVFYVQAAAGVASSVASLIQAIKH